MLIDERAIGTDLWQEIRAGAEPDNRSSTGWSKLGPESMGCAWSSRASRPSDVIVVNGLQHVRPGQTVAASHVRHGRPTAPACARSAAPAAAGTAGAGTSAAPQAGEQRRSCARAG